MEALLHYCWKHRLVGTEPMETDLGESVEVIDCGLHNNDAGPDFFNAKVRIGNELWAGNIEIHERSADWYLHGHDTDPAYDNVILHIVAVNDAVVKTASGRILPQATIKVPPEIMRNYRELQATEHFPPCYKGIPYIEKLKTRAWLTALQTERLERKTDDIAHRATLLNNDWEAVFFTTLARNFGFGVNGDTFEQWALNLNLQYAAHHRDDIFQVEAFFLGQAGLLSDTGWAKPQREKVTADEYYQQLKKEYEYLQHKFRLTPINGRLWKYLRMRPQNFPHIRIVQLAKLYCERRTSLASLIGCKDTKALRQLLNTGVTDYWQRHYTFGGTETDTSHRLSEASLNLLMINTAIPMMFAYGRHTMNEELCDRAIGMWESLKPEDNNIVRMWRECGLEVRNAGDTQALIQLKKEYCDRRDCLRCRFGYEYLKPHPQPLPLARTCSL